DERNSTTVGVKSVRSGSLEANVNGSLRNAMLPFEPRRKPVHATLQNRHSKPPGPPAPFEPTLSHVVANRRSVAPPATLFASPSKSSNANPMPSSSPSAKPARSSEYSGPKWIPLIPFGVASGGLIGASIQR